MEKAITKEDDKEVRVLKDIRLNEVSLLPDGSYGIGYTIKEKPEPQPEKKMPKVENKE